MRDLSVDLLDSQWQREKAAKLAGDTKSPQEDEEQSEETGVAEEETQAENMELELREPKADNGGVAGEGERGGQGGGAGQGVAEKVGGSAEGEQEEECGGGYVEFLPVEWFAQVCGCVYIVTTWP